MNNSVHLIATDKITVLKQPENELIFTSRIRPLSSCFTVLFKYLKNAQSCALSFVVRNKQSICDKIAF